MSSLRTIAQGELTANLEEILRQTEGGESFLITLEGRPVAQMTPYPRRQWVPKAEVLKLLQTCKPDPGLLEDLSEL